MEDAPTALVNKINNMEKRLLFLQTFVDDVLSNNRKTWAEYGIQFSDHPERLRKWVRMFKDRYPSTKQWYSGEAVTESWQGKVSEALEFADAVSPSKFPEKYDGVKPRRAWEQRTKGGDIVTLHSYEFQTELEDLKKFQDSILEKVTTLVTEAEIQPVFIPQKALGNTLALNIYTTDKHAGSLVRNPLYGNVVDNSEFLRRLEETLAVVKACQEMFGHLDLINFVDLGDGLDGVGGQTTRGGHGLDQYLDDTDQFDLFVNSHKIIFDQLVQLGASNRLRFTAACNDNHGGFGMYVAARALGEYLKARYPQIETDIQRAFIFHQDYGLHRFIYTHGKDDRYRSRPFPLKLDADTEKFFSEYIDFHGLSRHLSYSQERACVHVIKGDLHSSAEEFAKRFRYKNIMSMFGSSTWIQHNFGAGYRGFEFEIVDANKPRILSGKNFYF